MDIGLLNKYCSNTCTEEELLAVTEWFKASAGTPVGKNLLQKVWNETNEEDNPDPDLSLILDKIHHKVNLNNSEKILEKAGYNIPGYNRREHFINVFSKIAATLLLPILIFGSILTVKYFGLSGPSGQPFNQVFSSVDAITKVTLPDGSDVWLNRSSSLRYPANFAGRTRSVELTGEGYFEVVKNSAVPFVVRAGAVNVTVRGTTFNICAYPDDDKVETTLISGVVELQAVDPEGRKTCSIEMKPSDMVIYEKAGNRTFSHIIDDDRNYAWKDGMLIFKNEPMDEVIKKLGRWFNVDISIADPKLRDFTYTATFVHETLPQVLELLRMATPVNYSVSKREKVDDGTFSKQKVILTYRKGYKDYN